MPLTRDVIHKLPLNEQVLAFMQNSTLLSISCCIVFLMTISRLGHILGFYQLLDMLSPDLKARVNIEAELITALGTVAVLVRGAWVLKSAKVSPPLSGQMEAIRNYLLLVLALGDSDYFEKPADLAAKVPTTPQIVKALIEPICYLEKEGWRIKVAKDPKFEANHPAVVTRYLKSWEVGKTKIADALSATPASPQKTVAQSAQAASGPARLVQADDAHREIVACVTALLQNYGVLDHLQIKKKFEECLEGKSPLFRFPTLTPDTFKQHSKQLAAVLASGLTSKVGSAYYLATVNDAVTDTVTHFSFYEISCF